MNTHVRSLVLMMLMVTAGVVGSAMRPTNYLADQREKIDLERIVPRQFGDWQELPQSTAQIVNPQQVELLQKLYSQTLSRTYVNKEGSIIMLSIAYGANQSDSMALHYPDVCYPAQGFQVLSNEKDTLDTGFGVISIKRLMTKLDHRAEPVTYWTTIGNQVVRGGIETKLAQLRYGFKRQIPDGLIFRISSLTRDQRIGYFGHDIFVKKLFHALSTESRSTFIGNTAETALQ